MPVTPASSLKSHCWIACDVKKQADQFILNHTNFCELKWNLPNPPDSKHWSKNKLSSTAKWLKGLLLKLSSPLQILKPSPTEALSVTTNNPSTLTLSCAETQEESRKQTQVCQEGSQVGDGLLFSVCPYRQLLKCKYSFVCLLQVFQLILLTFLICAHRYSIVQLSIHLLFGICLEWTTFACRHTTVKNTELQGFCRTATEFHLGFAQGWRS